MLSAPLAFGCRYHTDNTNINTGARFRTASYFLTFMPSLATFWKHSSLKKTCRTNENVDSVDLNLLDLEERSENVVNAQLARSAILKVLERTY